MILNIKRSKQILYGYGFLLLLSIIGGLFLNFRFDFEQFFPEGDEDLAFYNDFIKDFEKDDNFLMIGVERKEGVFDQNFLNSVRDATNDLKSIKSVQKAQSLPAMRYPVKTPFGYTTKPLIHIDDASYYEQDKTNLLNDARFKNTLISEDGTALVIALKTAEIYEIENSKNFMDSVKQVLLKNNISDYHILGRVNFQSEIVRIQREEFIFCTIISLFLVIFVIWSIYRSKYIVAVTIGCVLVSLTVFVGFLGLSGRDLSLMSALYPVIILIVSTSDVIHLLTKYLDEVHKGHTDKQFIVNTTLKEVGMSTLITSVSTSLGFLALVTSRILPVRDFGINCAVGVLLAFFVTVPLCLIFMTMIPAHGLPAAQEDKKGRWDRLVEHIYQTTILKPKTILLAFLALIVFSIVGINRISTNYSIKENIPINAQVGKDFLFFEEKFNGFRPLEIAVMPKDTLMAEDYAVLKEIDKIERQLYNTKHVGNITSLATIYKSFKMLENENNVDSFVLPSEEEYASKRAFVNKMASTENNILVSKNGKNTRISCRVSDVGADTVKLLGQNLDRWIAANVDTNVVSVKQTGTSIILDKNSLYVKESLLWGLLFSLLSVSILMAILLKDIKMFVIAFIPNFIPLLFIGAILGWLNIELEAGISIVFGIVYGIVVDDTIHFFGRYKICLTSGLSVEESLKTTFDETGKAMLFATLILFSAFLVMLFTAQPLTRTVGTLISFTFLMAVFCDLYLIPILIRWVYLRNSKA